MTYKITPKVIELVEKLFDAGYQGSANITSSYASGAGSILGNSLSVKLSGFCKETLNIVEDVDSGDLVFVGRYDTECCDGTVNGLVELAYRMYKSYKGSGYGIPYEFEELFQKYGYIRKQVAVVEKWEEA